MSWDGIFYLKSWLQAQFDAIDTGGGGGNPTGGSVDVALQNHFNSALELLRQLKVGTLAKQGLYRLYADGHSASSVDAASSGYFYNSGSKYYRSTSKLNGLYHMNGTGTATTGNMTNSNLTFGAMTIDVVNASPQYDTTNKKFGSASLALIGASNQYLNVSPTTPGSQDFTFNCWYRPSSMVANQCILAIGNSKSLAFRLTTTTMDLQFSTDGSNYTDLTSTAISWVDGTWYHLEWVRSGSTIYFFRDGVALGTGTIGAVTVSSQAGGKMGRSNNGSNEQIDGNLDEVAWRIGEALHTTTFTPPAAETTDLEIDDINLVSTLVTADSSPTNLHIMLIVDDVTFGDSITVNTDLIVSVSRDNGANYQAVTMVRGGDWAPLSNQYLYIGVVSSFSVPTGTQLRYKIQTDNSKRMLFYGTAMAWAA